MSLSCLWSLVASLSARSVGDGGPHDVHHSLPADCQSGPGGLEASNMGLQLVLHVSPRICRFIQEESVVPVDDRMDFFFL